MGLQDITDKILVDAKVKAEDIIKDAENEAAEILKAANAKTADLCGEILSKGEKDAVKREKSADIASAIELKNAVLTEKQNLIDEAINSAKEAILGMKTPEYRSMLKNILVNVVSSGDEKVIASHDDKDRINNEFINSVNEELKSKITKCSLSLVYDKGIEGGFILEKGGIRIDCSIRTLLADSRSELQERLAKILFA